jgi:bifunctional non-homologous end joining protein LigD
MLCGKGAASVEFAESLGAGWTYDIKYDGIRCLAFIEADASGLSTVKLINRNGVDMTFRYPEIEGALMLWGDDHADRLPAVFDGEIMVSDPASGLPMFKWAHQRDSFGPGRLRDIGNWAASHPATYLAFDCLADHADIRQAAQQVRLEHLHDLVDPGNDRFRASRTSSDATAMLAFVEKFSLEGLIAKKLDAPYRGGSRSVWIKMKPVQTCTAIAYGYKDGEGKRKDWFGALLIEVHKESCAFVSHGHDEVSGDYDRGDLECDCGMVDLGKVGTGFDTNALNLVDPLIKSGQRLLCEVEFQERQPGTGKLRFPSFKGLRFDLHEWDCTDEQFA